MAHGPATLADGWVNTQAVGYSLQITKTLVRYTYGLALPCLFWVVLSR